MAREKAVVQSVRFGKHEGVYMGFQVWLRESSAAVDGVAWSNSFGFTYRIPDAASDDLNEVDMFNQQRNAAIARNRTLDFFERVLEIMGVDLLDELVGLELEVEQGMGAGSISAIFGPHGEIDLESV